MKIISILLSILLPLSANSMNLMNDLVGEWEQFESGFEMSYTYLRLNQDNSGVFATVRSNGKPHVDIIMKSQIKVNEDFIEIDFGEKGEYKAKIVLSGYTLPSNTSEGLATGMLYMYSKKEKEWKLFNTIFLRLNKITTVPFIDKVSKLHQGIKRE